MPMDDKLAYLFPQTGSNQSRPMHAQMYAGMTPQNPMYVQNVGQPMMSNPMMGGQPSVGAPHQDPLAQLMAMTQTQQPYPTQARADMGLRADDKMLQMLLAGAR